MRTTLIALIVLGGALWFWFEARRHHEHACASVRRALSRSQAQLLDDTVSLCALSVSRTPGGRLGLRRSYAFEVTYDRVSRQRGTLTLLADSVQVLDLPEPPP